MWGSTNCSNKSNFILYADDTSIFYSHPDLQQLQNTLNNELNNVSNWFKANRLSLNVSKTNYITFCSKNVCIRNLDNLLLKMDDNLLTKVDCVNFLGVYIDNNLSWNEHINHVSRKVSRCIGIFHRIKHILPLNALLSLYNALILPYLSYCNILLGQTLILRS